MTISIQTQMLINAVEKYNTTHTFYDILLLAFEGLKKANALDQFNIDMAQWLDVSIEDDGVFPTVCHGCAATATIFNIVDLQNEETTNIFFKEVIFGRDFDGCVLASNYIKKQYAPFSTDKRNTFKLIQWLKSIEDLINDLRNSIPSFSYILFPERGKFNNYLENSYLVEKTFKNWFLISDKLKTTPWYWVGHVGYSIPLLQKEDLIPQLPPRFSINTNTERITATKEAINDQLDLCLELLQKLRPVFDLPISNKKEPLNITEVLAEHGLHLPIEVDAVEEDSHFEDSQIPDDYDGQPDEAQEWHDFDPDC